MAVICVKCQHGIPRGFKNCNEAGCHCICEISKKWVIVKIVMVLVLLLEIITKQDVGLVIILKGGIES